MAQKNSNLLAIGLVMGGVIGAGVFSLPYAFIQVGLGRSLLYLGFLTLISIINYFLFVEVILKTPGQRNYVGLATYYFGKTGEAISFLTSVAIVFLVLFIYLILAGRFVALIWPNVSPLFTALPFWLLASISTFFNIKKLVEVEFLTSIAIGFIVLIIFIFSLSNFSANNLVDYFQGLPMAGFWFPVGPILFALSGRAAISELIKYTKKDVKKIIFLSFAAIAAIYFIFSVSVVVLTNGSASEDTITGLAGQLPSVIIFLIVVMGLMALWHIYVLLGFDLNNILTKDLKWPEVISGLVVVFVPLLLYLINWQSFFVIVAIVGGIFATAENILIILMWLKMKREKELPHWLACLALAVFVVIFVHESLVQVGRLDFTSWLGW